MSIDLMARVWKMDVRANELAVLLALADHANDDGWCWPSMGLVAWKIGVNERTVRRIVDDLERRGVVEKRGRPGTTAMIRLHLDALEPKQPYRSDPGQNVRGATMSTPDKMSGLPRTPDVRGGRTSGVRGTIIQPSIEPVADATLPKAARQKPKREDRRIWAMVSEYATGNGFPRSQMTDSQANAAYDAFATMKLRPAEGAIQRCTEYLRTTFRFRDAGSLRPRNVVDAYPAWIADGEPVAAADGKRTDDLVHTGTVGSTIDRDAVAAELERRRKWREDRGLPPEGETPIEAARRAADRARQRTGT